MPRGGERAGQPGRQYSNRADLQSSPRTAGKEKVYGDVARQQAVQRTPDAAPTQTRPAPPPPGSLTSLGAPSDHPNEPVTAGLALGPGPGPEALSAPPAVNDDLYELRALYQQFPHDDLRRLIERAEREPR